MLLSEPPRSQYDLNFHLLGIPVRVHPLFWAATLLLGLSGNHEPVHMLIWVGAAFVSILAHEMGHALAARSHGWQPWITLHAMGGLASYQPSRQTPVSQILITAAGPGAGFLFAGLIVAMIRLSGHDVELGWMHGGGFPVRWELYSSMQANVLVYDLLYINIFWGLVNLLPIFPLDGGQITRAVWSMFDPASSLRSSLWLSVVAGAAMAVVSLVRLEDQFLAFFFAYLAYMSYQTLQSTYGPRGGWGGSR